MAIPTLYAGPGGIVGPDGEHLRHGDKVPKSWPADVRQGLLDAKAVTTTRPDVPRIEPHMVSVPAGEPQLVGPDAGEIALAHRGRNHAAPPADTTETGTALDTAAEVPWFTEPPLATLAWDAERPGFGWIAFIDPKGRKYSVPVTTGPGEFTGTGFGNVWHVEVFDDVAVVSPSVHYIGEWHTPNPVQFKLVPVLS